jgi:hypothetical protein
MHLDASKKIMQAVAKVGLGASHTGKLPPSPDRPPAIPTRRHQKPRTHDDHQQRAALAKVAKAYAVTPGSFCNRTGKNQMSEKLEVLGPPPSQICGQTNQS